MSIRWIIGMGMCFVLFTVMSNIIEQVDPLTANNMTTLERLLSYQTIEATDPIGTIFAGAGVLWTAIGALWDMLWFNYAFLASSNANPNFLGMMLKYTIFLPCTMGLLFGIALVIRSAIAR